MNNKTHFFISIAVMAVCTLSNSCTNDGNQSVGTTYYIDAINGSDANDGLSEDKAWRSIDKANGISLNEGDRLLLRRGADYSGILEVKAAGTEQNPVYVDAYGKGEKPRIIAPDNAPYAVLVSNSDHVTVRNLDISNHGSERLAGRTGIKVLNHNHGISKGITLECLDIHDVNGSLVKQEGGGSGILIDNRWDKDSIVSIFDGLTIDNCTVRRCERNAMIWSAPWSRRDWHPSTNIVVRNNLIEGVPGDGIVPIGCDGALIEYNLMRDCPQTLPDTEAAAGIWPWSCDNTVIQFNEVSNHKAPWDAQGFDSDYNCTNTSIQYNFSHDNDGGFLLICNSGSEGPGPEDNIGNIGSIIRYNVSIDDAVRQRLTRAGIFSPTIHIAGPVKNSLVERNILHVGVKPSERVDRSIITSDSWGGFADSTFFRNNVFFVPQPSAFRMNKSTNNAFDSNYYLGKFISAPQDDGAAINPDGYNSLVERSQDARTALSFLFENVIVGDGSANMQAVKKNSIEEFFVKLESAATETK